MEISCPQALPAAQKHPARNAPAALADISPYPDLAENPIFPSPTHTKVHPFMSPELSSGELSPADPSCPSIAQGSMGWQGLNQCQAPGWCPNSLDKPGPEPEPVSWLLF